MEALILALLAIPSNDVFLSYEKDIKPIFSQVCSGCHAGNTSLPNLLNFETAFKYRYEIKNRIDNRSMPHIGAISESNRDQIRMWVDGGANK